MPCTEFDVCFVHTAEFNTLQSSPRLSSDVWYRYFDSVSKPRIPLQHYVQKHKASSEMLNVKYGHSAAPMHGSAQMFNNFFDRTMIKRNFCQTKSSVPKVGPQTSASRNEDFAYIFVGLLSCVHDFAPAPFFLPRTFPGKLANQNCTRRESNPHLDLTRGPRMSPDTLAYLHLIMLRTKKVSNYCSTVTA